MMSRKPLASLCAAYDMHVFEAILHGIQQYEGREARLCGLVQVGTFRDDNNKATQKNTQALVWGAIPESPAPLDLTID